MVSEVERDRGGNCESEEEREKKLERKNLFAEVSHELRNEVKGDDGEDEDDGERKNDDWITVCFGERCERREKRGGESGGKDRGATKCNEKVSSVCFNTTQLD